MKLNFLFGLARAVVALERCEGEPAKVSAGVFGFKVTVELGRNGWV